MDVGICSHDPQHPDAHPDCTPSFWHLVCRRPSRGYGWVGFGPRVDCWHADCRESTVTTGLGGSIASNHLRNRGVFCSSLFELKKCECQSDFSMTRLWIGQSQSSEKDAIWLANSTNI